MELDPDFALAHAGLADAWATLGIYNVRAPSEVMPAAGTAASRALDLDPALAEAHEALRIAGELDPDAPAIEASVGVLLFLERRYPEAERRLSGLTAAHPDFAMGHFFLGGVLERSGRWPEALASLEAACELRGRSPEALAAHAQTPAFPAGGPNPTIS